MTDQEIRIAIAEECGWRRGYTGNSHWVSDPHGIRRGWSMLRDVADSALPDYLNDLNAMNAAEAWLKKDDPHAFACYASDLFEEHGSDVIHLSAAQRAEAFLKTLNLWKPWHTSSLC